MSGEDISNNSTRTTASELPDDVTLQVNALELGFLTGLLYERRQEFPRLWAKVVAAWRP